VCDSACQAARAAAQAAFAAAASKMGKVISTVVHAIGTNPITRPGAASGVTTIAHTGPSNNDGTAGGPGYTAGTSGYWLDANGNYVSMADGTIYCGSGNSVNCELSSIVSSYLLVTGPLRGLDGRFIADSTIIVDSAYARVTLWAATKAAILAAAPRDANGNFIDPNTGQIIPASGPYHFGHIPGFEYWRNRDMAALLGWTRSQFIQFENDPTHYQVEDPYGNMSHRYEQP
jgi:hypothetical protein